MNISIEPATPEDAKDHYEVATTCAQTLHAMLVILSAAGRLEGYDDATLSLALEYYARLGTLLTEQLEQQLDALNDLVPAQKVGKK
jgi:hypothetical protein